MLQQRSSLTPLGSTALATKWYLCMALAHWQMEVQALETFDMAAGVKSSLSMYGWILLMTWSRMLSCGEGGREELGPCLREMDDYFWKFIFSGTCRGQQLGLWPAVEGVGGE